MIVEGGVTTRNALELVVEIYHYFAQRHEELNLHAVARDEVLFHQFCTLTQTKRHDGTNIVGCRDDCGTDIWLFHMIYHCGVWHATRVMHFLHTTLLVIDHIAYVRNRCNHIHIELAVQTFLHNLHVKKSEESATETEAQGCRTLVLESQ